MKVPGRKNKVTRVMILIDTVSCLVFCAISCISFVDFSMLLVDDWVSRVMTSILRVD